MANQKVLLVDSDAKSQRVLEVSLKKAGFEVTAARTVEEAQIAAIASPPDVVLTEADFPVSSGFELCRRLRDDARTAGVAVMFLAQDGSPEAKIRAISAGADEYLTKPTFVKEILTRISGLLERRRNDALSKKDRPANFRGTLGGMGLVDIFQLIETGRKSGVLHLRSDPARSGGLVANPAEAAMWFKDGRAVDAEVGVLRGEAAVYRLLLWDDGEFELEFGPVTRDTTIHTSMQGLLLEGMRRVDEWARLAPLVPPLHARLEVDYRALALALPAMPAEVEQVVKLFDGRRKLLDALDDAPVDELAALGIVARLIEEDVLTNASSRASIPVSTATLDAWLSQRKGSADSAGALSVEAEDILANLPSELTAAMIPSQETASQILAAADIPLTEPPRAAETARPEPLVDEPPAGVSAILSRSTIPASGGAARSSFGSAPASAAQPGAPNDGRLTVRRLSSVVAPPPDVAAPPSSQPAPPRRAPEPSVTEPLAPSPLPRAAASTSASAPEPSAGAGPHHRSSAAPPPPESRSLPVSVPVVPPRPVPPSVPPPQAGSGPQIPMMVRPAAAPEATPDDGDLPAEGSSRPRRAGRGAAFRAVRRPGTAGRGAIPSVGPDLIDEVTETSTPALPAPAAAQAAPLPPAPSKASVPPPEAASATPPAAAPPAAAPPAAAPTPARPAPIAHATPVAPPAAPPRAPAVQPPGERPARTTGRDLDDDFAYLKQNDEEPRGNGIQIILGLAVVGIVIGFIAWLTTDHKQQRITVVPTAAAPSQRTAAWPSAAPGDMQITTIARTTSITAVAAATVTATVAMVPEEPQVDQAQLTAELDRGLAALKKERFKEAEKAYAKAAELDPKSAAAQAGLGHALAQLQRYKEATSAAKAALTLSEDKLAHPYYVLGLVALDSNRVKEASEHFRRFIELDPASPFATNDVRSLAKP